MTSNGWDRNFHDPIPTGDGRAIRTLRDAGILGPIFSSAPTPYGRQHCMDADKDLFSLGGVEGLIIFTDDFNRPVQVSTG